MKLCTTNTSHLNSYTHGPSFLMFRALHACSVGNIVFISQNKVTHCTAVFWSGNWDLFAHQKVICILLEMIWCKKIYHQSHDKFWCILLMSMYFFTLYCCATLIFLSVAYCPSGQEYKNGACQDCAIGFWKNNTITPLGACTMCDNNIVTLGTGATTKANCSKGRNHFRCHHHHYDHHHHHHHLILHIF